MSKPVYWMNKASGLTISFPRNGQGGVSVDRTIGAHTTTAPTKTTITLTSANLSSVVDGDFIFLDTGHYGRVVSADNTSKVVTIWEEGWRLPANGIVAKGLIPSAATTATIHSHNFCDRAHRVRIKRLIVVSDALQNTITITDADGTVRWGYTTQGTGGSAGLSIPLDIVLFHPFGVTQTVSQASVVEFEIDFEG